MIRAAYLAGINAIALTTSAFAQQTAIPPAQQTPIDATGQKPPPKEKLICREENTGRLVPTRICRTAAEWKQAESEGQGNLDALQDSQRRCGMGTIC
jgi:hypothetical protein